MQLVSRPTLFGGVRAWNERARRSVIAELGVCEGCEGRSGMRRRVKL